MENGIIALFMIVSVLAVAVAATVLSLVRQAAARRRDRQRLNAEVDQAIAGIMADGKVVLPKGKLTFRNWARKWMGYSHSLPPPRAGSSAFQYRSSPDLPKDEK